MKGFLIAHRKGFTALGCLLAIGAVVGLIAGCGVPTWLTDAQGIVGEVALSIASIGSFIAGLTGNTALAAGLAVVSAWVAKIEAGITDVEQLVTQYNTTPDAGTLANIEAALADVQANIQQDFSNLGLPSTILDIISGVAGLALSQLEAWGSLIPAIKAQAMTSFTVKTPYTKAEFATLINAKFEAHTGDAEIDAALAKVKRLK